MPLRCPLILVALFFAPSFGAFVNRTVALDWANPIRSDPFLSLPIPPRSIPYFYVEISESGYAHIQIQKAEFYISVNGKYQQPVEVPYARGAGIIIAASPYQPDRDFSDGSILNIRMLATSTANSVVTGYLGYIGMSGFRSGDPIPFRAPELVALPFKTYAYTTPVHSNQGTDFRFFFQFNYQPFNCMVIISGVKNSEFVQLTNSTEVKIVQLSNSTEVKTSIDVPGGYTTYFFDITPQYGTPYEWRDVILNITYSTPEYQTPTAAEPVAAPINTRIYTTEWIIISAIILLVIVALVVAYKYHNKHKSENAELEHLVN